MKRALKFRLRCLRIGLVAAYLAGAAGANPSEARRLLDRGAHEDARDLYQSLADSARFDSRRAALRLGEGLAAYRGGDFRGARTGFSGALLSPDTRIRGKAHVGLGNSLFQLGWTGLADSPYPDDPAETPDLDRFDAIARDRIARMLDSPAPETGESDGFVRIRDTILNWSDAARHYQSALDLDSTDPVALANRRTTMAFLERLRDLLEEERDETEQSIPDPSPQPGEGEGQPEPGENAGEEPGEEPHEGGQGEEENPEGGGEEEGEETEGSGDNEPDENPPPEGEGEGEPQDAEPGETESPDPGDIDPNETPEERARRKLSENADVETGPINPGQREFRLPEKDW